MPFSHHSHSGEFCMHARGTLDQSLKEAVKKGFKVYALTEHVPRYRTEDLYPEEVGVEYVQGLWLISLQNHLQPDDLLTTFNTYLNQAHALRRAYAKKHPSLEILVGCETEYIREGSIPKLLNLLESHNETIHFVVASVHHVRAVPIDFDRSTFVGSLVAAMDTDTELKPVPTKDLQVPDTAKHGDDASAGSKRQGAANTESVTTVIPKETLNKIFLDYFDAQHELVRRLKPMVIGHFDLIRLWCEDVKFQDYPEVWAKIERNVKEVIEYGGLFEVNAAAFRKGWSSAYPQKDVLQLILSLGGHLTISDDSHAPESVGLHYDKLYHYLRDNNVDKLWYLTVDKTAPATQGHKERVIAKEVEGSWWEDPFWQGILKPKDE